MTETSRIKLKIGEHEFEAEGPPESVQSQFEAFKELISLLPSKKQESISETVHKFLSSQQIANEYSLEKIMRVSGRVVSLTALPASTEDAALLVMLGNHDLRNNESATGQEIGDGLAQSGRPVQRVDRVMDKALQEALVLKSGVKRSTRYRLTNQGMAKARTLAKDLIASLP